MELQEIKDVILQAFKEKRVIEYLYVSATNKSGPKMVVEVGDDYFVHANPKAEKKLFTKMDFSCIDIVFFNNSATYKHDVFKFYRDCPEEIKVRETGNKKSLSKTAVAMVNTFEQKYSSVCTDPQKLNELASQIKALFVLV